MKISDKLSKSIGNRCIENASGKIVIPKDIIERVKKENPDFYLLKRFQIENKILIYLNSIL